MKKIMMALAFAGLASYGAGAQEINKVCKKTDKGDISCYKTKYAQNFPVCKDNYGYAICGETRNFNNSTSPRTPATTSHMNYTYDEQETVYAPLQQGKVPQSQSYPQYEENATVPYGAGYDETKKSPLKYCYTGDKVSELGRNPYRGCPSPEDDGPDATKLRAWTHGN